MAKINLKTPISMLFSPGETRQCVEAVPENGRGEVEAQAGLPLHLRPAQVHQTGPHGEFFSMPVTIKPWF